MKLFRSFLVILICCIFLWIAITLTRTVPAGNQALESVQNLFQNTSHSFFSDSEWGLSLSYPRPWKQTYVPPNMAVFRGDHQETMIISVEKLKEANTSLSDYTRETLGEIADSQKMNNQLIILSAPQHTTLAGFSAMSIEYRETIGGIMYVGEQVWTVHNGRAYTMTYSYPQSQHNTSVQTFQTMVESVKIAHS